MNAIGASRAAFFTDAVDVKFVDDGPNHDTAPPELAAHVAHALVIVPLA